METLSIEELKKMRRHSAALCHDSYVSALDELISIREARGVPVAWLNQRGPVRGLVTMSPTMAHSWEMRGDDVTPLFTAPQKPVLLPEKSINDYNRYWIDYQDTVAAIEAAGGIVKESE